MSRCHLCAFDELCILPSYEALHRVTSDCKPWPPGGQLAVCRRCGGAQAVISQQWQEEARQIYDRYTIYHQGDGAEPSAFDAATGAAGSRSSQLLSRLEQELPFRSHGRLLDVGCGNGTTLRVFSERNPGWSLAGLDINDHYQSIVTSIPGVDAFYMGTITGVPGQFDVIILLHSLEHIVEPVRFLAELWHKLVVGGTLVVQVPDCWRNPFMFLVADHAAHFFKSELCATVTSSGYDVLIAADDWVEKELTVVARKGAAARSSRSSASARNNIAAVSERLQWLIETLDEARELAEREPIALFGTSIAATWLTAELGDRVVFYVDEDPHRAGQSHLDRPIYSPDRAPGNAPVLIALPPVMAARVKHRLEQQGVPLRLYVPASLPRVGRNSWETH